MIANSLSWLKNNVAGSIRAGITFLFVLAFFSYGKSKHILKQSGKASIPKGTEKLKGYQLRYIKILNPNYKLNCPSLPFSEIEKQGAGMYKGKKK